MELVNRFIVLGLVAAISSISFLTIADDNSANTDSLPQWVLQPDVVGMLSAAECTKSMGDESLDLKLALAMSRFSLSQKVRTKLVAITKILTADAPAEKVVPDNIEALTKTLWMQIVDDAQLIQSDYVEYQNETLICALIRSENAFEKLLDVFGGTLMGDKLLEFQIYIKPEFSYSNSIANSKSKHHTIFDDDLYRGN